MAAQSLAKPKLKTGKFTLHIHRAQKLFDTTTIGKQDPYAKLQLGSLKKDTKVVEKGGKEAVWEEEIATTLTGFEEKLQVEVFHRGMMSDTLIGHASIPMSQFLCGDLPPTWYRLNRDMINNFAGEVLISSKFVDDDKSSEIKENAAKEAVTRLQAKIQFLEASIAQKEKDIAEEEIVHGREKDALKQEIADLKEKNAKLETAAAKAGDLESKMHQMIPDPVVEDCFENFRYMPLKGWLPPYLPTDRWAWSNAKGTEERTKDGHRLPANWQWTGDWSIDTVRIGVDKDGWEFAKDFSTEWHSASTKLDCVRRRRWVRRREYVVPK